MRCLATREQFLEDLCIECENIGQHQHEAQGRRMSRDIAFKNYFAPGGREDGSRKT
jgi:hypothetical protein